MRNVPIVTGASIYTDRNTGRLSIIVINEALYYGKKLGHYLINPNQLRPYGTMIWDNPFDSNIEVCIETEGVYKIDLIANGTKIEFNSISPTEPELKLLPHVHIIQKFQWNPKTVQLVEVRSDAFETKYIASQCRDLGDTEKGDHKYQDMKADESICPQSTQF